MSSLKLDPDEQPWRIEATVIGYGKPDPNDRISLDHVKLRDADYSGRKLKHFVVIGSSLERCRFESAHIGDFLCGAGRELSEYVDCNFSCLRTSHMRGGFARFIRCSFKDVDIRDWFCFNAEFIDCVFTGRLRKCVFNGAVSEEDRSWVGRDRNDFRGNDFSGATLIDVAFRTGVDLERQRLPCGPDYLYVPNAAAAIVRAKEGLKDWMPGTEFHRQAMVIVDVYAQTIEVGQEQLFVSLSGLYAKRSRFPREVVDTVVGLLRSQDE